VARAGYPLPIYLGWVKNKTLPWVNYWMLPTSGELKREFGKELTFWGGGVDTQRTLPFGTPEEVREETKRRIEELATGGGFVFSAVHNIQADVPPENIMAMWETLQAYGVC